MGPTNPGTPSKRRRYKKEMVDGIYETVSYFKEVKRPAMVEDFFLADLQPLIGMTNYVKDPLRVKKWWCCSYATGFEMCIVDAYLAYKFDVEKADGSILVLSEYARVKSFPADISSASVQFVY